MKKSKRKRKALYKAKGKTIKYKQDSAEVKAAKKAVKKKPNDKRKI